MHEIYVFNETLFWSKSVNCFKRFAVEKVNTDKPGIRLRVSGNREMMKRRREKSLKGIGKKENCGI